MWLAVAAADPRLSPGLVRIRHRWPGQPAWADHRSHDCFPAARYGLLLDRCLGLLDTRRCPAAVGSMMGDGGTLLMQNRSRVHFSAIHHVFKVDGLQDDALPS